MLRTFLIYFFSRFARELLYLMSCFIPSLILIFVLCSTLFILTFVMFCSPQSAVVFVIVTVSTNFEDLVLIATFIIASQCLVVVPKADFWDLVFDSSTVSNHLAN